MILCDSNIFLIDRFFKRDVHATQTLGEYFETLMEELFRRYGKRMTWLDAQILLIAEEYAVTHLVTWNKKDFVGRTNIRVATPEEFLTEQNIIPESR